MHERFVLEKYTFPALSVATAAGVPMDAQVPRLGVGGGFPPAIVETTYCWAYAVARHNKRMHNTRAEFLERFCRLIIEQQYEPALAETQAKDDRAAIEKGPIALYGKLSCNVGVAPSGQR